MKSATITAGLVHTPSYSSEPLGHMSVHKPVSCGKRYPSSQRRHRPLLSHSTQFSSHSLHLNASTSYHWLTWHVHDPVIVLGSRFSQVAVGLYARSFSHETHLPKA